MTVLYLSYDGMCDHIAESQVLPYVLGLAERGWRMTIVSHEKAEVSVERRKRVDARLSAAGVTWRPLPYLRRSPLGALPIHVALEIVAGLREARSGPVDLVHARSYVPAAAASVVARLLGAKMIFDIRGFWFDEKVDAGAWRDGSLYRVGKRGERALFRACDAVVTLTDAAARELNGWPEVGGRGIPTVVIPTCVDVRPYGATRRSPTKRGPLLAYLGSFGARYLTDSMLGIFAAVRQREPTAHLLVLATNATEDVARARVRHGVPPEAVTVTSAPHAEIPARLADVDATFCLIKTGFAVRATCPTKFGESLAAGAPVIVNDGIGDCAQIVREERVGVVTAGDGSDADATATALLALLREGEAMRARCRETARARFDLALALDRYDGLYRSLLAGAA